MAIVENVFGFSALSMSLDRNLNSRSSTGSNSFSRMSTEQRASSLGLEAESYNQRSIGSRMTSAIGNLKQKINRKVQIVEDLEEFKRIVYDEKEALVAVMFYSPVCKACKAAKPLFNKLAQKYTDVKFISVPMTKANSNGLESMNVTKFPFGHIYDENGELVNELGLLRKLIPRFEESLQSHIDSDLESGDEPN